MKKSKLTEVQTLKVLRAREEGISEINPKNDPAH
jgi:hypothetical protein